VRGQWWIFASHRFLFHDSVSAYNWAYSVIVQFINPDLRVDSFSNWFYGNVLERIFLLSGLSNEVDKLQLQSR